MTVTNPCPRKRSKRVAASSRAPGRFRAARQISITCRPTTVRKSHSRGRSNVGKSTLINALVGQLRLARASNTPGRTQELNFFTEPEDSVYLVDMPGYGFAQAPKDKVAAWNSTLRGYLSGRRTLLRVILLVDARHGLKPADEEMMTLLDTAAVSYQVILTKADKISQTDLAKTMARTTQALAKHPAAYPSVIATSAETGMGFEELRAVIAKLLDAHGK